MPLENVLRLNTYPNITPFKVSDPPRFRGFRGGSTIANIFFVLRDIGTLSKQRMFKIDQPFDQKNFQVRASECVRYILHHIFRILKKSSFFHVFWRACCYEYFRYFRKRYRHVF